MNTQDAKMQRFIYKWGIFALMLAFASIAWQALGSPSFGVFVCLVVIQLYGFYTFNLLRYWQEFNPQKPITALLNPPPEALINSVPQIEALGFQSLGYVQGRSVPLGCFTNAEGTIYGFMYVAEPEKVGWILSTRYANGAYIVTNTLSGEIIHSENYITNLAPDISKALALHEEAIEKRNTSILPVLTLQDAIEADYIWGQTHKRNHFRRQFRLYQLLIASSFITAVVGLGGVVLLLSFPQLDSLFVLLPLAVMISAKAYVSRFVRVRWNPPSAS